MTSPSFPRRAPYPAALKSFKRGFSLAAGSAILIAVALGASSSGVYLLLGLLLLVHAVDWLFGHPARPSVRRRLQEWSVERYDTSLSAHEARVLLTPAKDAEGRVGDWCSQAVNVLYQNEAGDYTYIEVRLVRHGSNWFLYSPDYGNELPYIQDSTSEQEQDLSIALSPLMGEVMETGGMFFLNAGDINEVGRIVRVTEEESGQRILLLWSDLLRAELWQASTAGSLGDNLQPLHITGEGLIKELLPSLEADGTLVGLNWGADGATAFPAATVRTFLSRYF